RAWQLGTARRFVLHCFSPQHRWDGSPRHGAHHLFPGVTPGNCRILPLSPARGHMIAWTIYATFAGALALLFLPRAFSRWIALLTTVAGFAISLIALFQTPIADLFLLFVFYELVIVPKYFLIAIFGSTNKEYGAMKLTLYSFFGGALVFIGILAAYVTAGTLDLNQLAQFQFAPQLQLWAFPVLFLGFAVLAGIWPLHTWAPTGHVAAPTAGSMLLAGIVMKLGSYGGLRVAMNLFP